LLEWSVCRRRGPGKRHKGENVTAAPRPVELFREIFPEKRFAVYAFNTPHERFAGSAFVVPGVLDSQCDFVGQRRYEIRIHSPTIAIGVVAPQAQQSQFVSIHAELGGYSRGEEGRSFAEEATGKVAAWVVQHKGVTGEQGFAFNKSGRCDTGPSRRHPLKNFGDWVVLPKEYACRGGVELTFQSSYQSLHQAF